MSSCGAETHLFFSGHSTIDASDTSARAAPGVHVGQPAPKAAPKVSHEAPSDFGGSPRTSKRTKVNCTFFARLAPCARVCLRSLRNETRARPTPRSPAVGSDEQCGFLAGTWEAWWLVGQREKPRRRRHTFEFFELKEPREFRAPRVRMHARPLDLRPPVSPLVRAHPPACHFASCQVSCRDAKPRSRWVFSSSLFSSRT